tara:strand:- start:741 stop:2519 length:1779 start_codon:yes stop_codon:yes gene_type:complete
MRLSDYIIKFLEQKKIDTVFQVSGGGSIFLGDALYKAKKIRYIAHHHEQAASFAAEGYARCKNDVGCCFVTTGPGGTNAVTGISSAWIDSVPVIFIAGQAFYNQTIKKTKKRQIGVQEINIIDIVKPITKFSIMVKDPEMINFYLEKAYQLCKSGRPGPVFLDIPADVQNAQIDEKKVKRLHYKALTEKNLIDNQINKVIEKLKKSERPLIHLGHGVKLSKSKRLVNKFFNKFRIPFMVTWNADDLISSDHKMYFGKPGQFGERGSNFIVQNCDFYLSIGTRLPYMITGYNPKDFAKKAKYKIMVDIDKNELKKNDLNLNLRIKSDAKRFLEKLFSRLKSYKSNNDWVDYCSKVRAKYPILVKKMKNEKKYINSYFFIQKLSQKLSKNDVVITDMGFSFTTTHQALEIKGNQKLYTNSGHAPMGWGLPAAIGAYYSNKYIKSNIICISGEGGFQMNIQELATIMHNKIPMKIFIFNNGGYLTIKQTQILGFSGRIMGADKKSGISFPNYEKISRAHSIEYKRLTRHKNLENEIKKILKSKKAFICELIMNPNEEQIPKAVNRRNEHGISIPAKLEDMYPFLSKDELSSNNLD